MWAFWIFYICSIFYSPSCQMNIRAYSTVEVYDVWCALIPLNPSSITFQLISSVSNTLNNASWQNQQWNQIIYKILSRKHSKQWRLCRNIFFYKQIQIHKTDTKALTAECWPRGPALNCTSFGRRRTNKYTHATVSNIYQMECTKKHQRAACGNSNVSTDK